MFSGHGAFWSGLRTPLTARGPADIPNMLFARSGAIGFLSHLRSLRRDNEPEILHFALTSICLVNAYAGHASIQDDQALEVGLDPCRIGVEPPSDSTPSSTQTSVGLDRICLLDEGVGVGFGDVDIGVGYLR